jgi:hypothetical protein
MIKCSLTPWRIFLTSLFILSPYLLFFITGSGNQGSLFEEDGVFENASALSFFISSLLFSSLFITIWKTEAKHTKLKIGHYLMLILGFLFFVFAGEEISWGQRIFNVETPDLLKEINVQREINLHNVRIFDVTEPNGHLPKKGMARMITANRMFSIFWFVFCVVIPVLNRLSKSLADLMKKIAFPVVPLWISAFFILNFVVSKAIQEIGFFKDLYVRMTSGDMSAGFLFRLTEIKEFGYAFLFFVFSLEFLLNLRDYNSEKPN